MAGGSLSETERLVAAAGAAGAFQVQAGAFPVHHARVGARVEFLGNEQRRRFETSLADAQAQHFPPLPGIRSADLDR